MGGKSRGLIIGTTIIIVIVGGAIAMVKFLLPDLLGWPQQTAPVRSPDERFVAYFRFARDIIDIEYARVYVSQEAGQESVVLDLRNGPEETYVSPDIAWSKDSRSLAAFLPLELDASDACIDVLGVYNLNSRRSGQANWIRWKQPAHPKRVYLQWIDASTIGIYGRYSAARGTKEQLFVRLKVKDDGKSLQISTAPVSSKHTP
jgi:hypothetical protein